MSSPKMSRKKNWTEEETKVMVELVAEKHAIIRGKLSDVLHPEHKNQAWLDITLAIRAFSEEKRSVKDVKKKWQDLQLLVKKKEILRRKQVESSHPLPVTLRAWEQKVLGILAGNVKTLKASEEGEIDTLNNVINVSDSVTEIRRHKTHKRRFTESNAELVEIERQKLKIMQKDHELQARMVDIMEQMLENQKRQMAEASATYSSDQHSAKEESTQSSDQRSPDEGLTQSSDQHTPGKD